MTDTPTRNEIRASSAGSGLVGYLFRILKQRPMIYKEKTFLEDVAEVVNSGEVALFSDRDKDFLNGIRTEDDLLFFPGLHLVCQLVPALAVDHRALMALTDSLARLAGQDMAATQPYIAFRKWCEADLDRVRLVVEDAKSGDETAVAHLSYALEAGVSAVDALAFLENDSAPEAQRGAAVALGNMTLDSETASQATRSLAKQVLKNDNLSDVSANALLSCFAVLEKHATLSREEAGRALDKTLETLDRDTLRLLAELLWRHGNSLAEAERRRVTSALGAVNAEDKGTLQAIDFALSRLAQAGRSDAATALLETIIRQSQGKIGLDVFRTWQSAVFDRANNDNRYLSKLAASWLVAGDLYLCNSLARHINISEGRSQPLTLEAGDLPATPEEQMFLCRKAVGFLFTAPVVAASVLVAMLRHGDSGVADVALDLLYMPLLLSYGRGEGLASYLEEAAASCTGTDVERQINEKLDLKRQHADSLAGIERLAELHPSEIQRHIAQARAAQRMAHAGKAAEKQSVFHNLVSKQYLLYGNSWATYATGPRRGRRASTGAS